MNIGCFALVAPFQPLAAQLAQIRAMGFTHADVTDNTDGACLGVEFGFTALASLDAHPHDLRRLFEEHSITPTCFCAHANLLDPSAPWRYSSAQIIKAIRTASPMGLKHVVTTEGEPKTRFGVSLTDDEQIFAIAEKLAEPLRVAEDFGVKLLFEPHGPVSTSIAKTERLLDRCDSPALALNLDTGNCWLGGTDTIDYVKAFAPKIKHVHWKDMPAELEPERGQRFGCGMATIPLGDGAVDIPGVVDALKAVGFDGDTTLEIAGEDAVQTSAARLREWWG